MSSCCGTVGMDGTMVLAATNQANVGVYYGLPKCPSPARAIHGVCVQK